MNEVLNAPAPAGQECLSPAEMQLHLLITQINRKRSTVGLKEASLLRKNIREFEINALNADIREINAEILELEKEAENIKVLV